MRNALLLLVLVGVIGSGATTVERQAAPVVFTRANFGTPTTVTLPTNIPAGNGDPLYGMGLAIDGTRLWTSSWNPQVILEYAIPASFSGSATYVRTLGNLNQQGKLFGLYYDKASNRMCASSGVEYDGDASTALTLTCAEIDPATNTFKNGRHWMFGDATKPCRTLPAIATTDQTVDSVTFTAAHNLMRATIVMVSETAGGLSRTSYYYIYPRTPTAISFHKTYNDGYNNTAPIDLTAPITATVTSCTSRGDRRTMGGIVPVPPEFVSTFKGTHIVGFGGYQSVVSSGDSSMGPTGCAFNLPAQTYVGMVPCTPMLGYRWAATYGPTFVNRDGNYNNSIDWDSNPEKGADNVALYGHGKWAPGDTISQAGFFIGRPTGAVFGVLADVQQGCIWYGENYHGLWPTLFESPPVTPVATDVATSTVTLPVDWPTGAMVQLSSGQAGMVAQPSVYFLRALGSRHYQFFRSEEEARTGVLGLVPTTTDLTNDRVGFAVPHGIRTQELVHVETAGGGLDATDYYVNAAFPLALSFHLVKSDAAGTIYGQEKNKINLTAPITSRILAPPIKFTVPLTGTLRLKSYCVRSTGSKASLNSQGERHVFYSYDVQQLATVVAGASENVQPFDYDYLDFPGFTYPVGGLPGYPRQVLGVQWLDNANRLAVQIMDHTAEKKGRRVAFYPFTAGGTMPTKPTDLTLESAK